MQSSFLHPLREQANTSPPVPRQALPQEVQLFARPNRRQASVPTPAAAAVGALTPPSCTDGANLSGSAVRQMRPLTRRCAARKQPLHSTHTLRGKAQRGS